MYLMREEQPRAPIVLGDVTAPQLGSGVNFSPSFFLFLALGTVAIFSLTYGGVHLISGGGKS